MGLPKQSGLKTVELLGVELNYSLILKNNSFCLGVQGLLILAIHAMFFPSSLSGGGENRLLTE